MIKSTQVLFYLKMSSSNNFLLLNESYSQRFNLSEFSSRSKLHNLSTNVWLKTRHPKTTNLSYLCFPHEKQQHNMILEVFSLLNETGDEKSLDIPNLIKSIRRFNKQIPKEILWKLFHKHDYDKDNALNFNEFRNMALSYGGKILFRNLLERLKEKKLKKNTNYLPRTFNTLITQVSYRSARYDLLNKVKDVSLDINRRANNFFKLFTLQSKYKNPDDFDPENSKRFLSCQSLKDPPPNNDLENKIDETNSSGLLNNKYLKTLNESKCSEEINEVKEEIEKIVTNSKAQGCDIVKNACKNLKFQSNIQKFEDFYEQNKNKNVLIENKDKILTRRNTQSKIEKIMKENLKKSKLNNATKLFKKIIGQNNDDLQKNDKRQIKFHPIQINRKNVGEISIDGKQTENKLNEIVMKKEFDLFLPEIKKLKEGITMKKLRTLPTLTIFNEETSNVLKKKPPKIYFNED